MERRYHTVFKYAVDRDRVRVVLKPNETNISGTSLLWRALVMRRNIQGDIRTLATQVQDATHLMEGLNLEDRRG
jgi:hypothetical protein